MIGIFTGARIKELDRYTIEHEPVSSIDLVERAASTAPLGCEGGVTLCTDFDDA